MNSQEKSGPPSLGHQKIVEEARIFLRTEKEKGHIMPDEVAVALTMQREGRRVLQNKLRGYNMSKETSNFNYIFSRLDPYNQLDVLSGLGGVLLGSIILSLGKGAVNDWRDSVFVDGFNEGVKETIVPPLELHEVFATEQPDSSLTVSEETDIIIEESKTDKTFLGFLERVPNKRLPRSINKLFKTGNKSAKIEPLIMHDALIRAVIIYENAINAL